MMELPEPLIRCILPDYEDRHYQWLIGQYLERSGFHATLATFSLELKAKGYNLEDSVKLDEGVLRKTLACMCTRQLIGPSTVVPVHSGSPVQLSTGAAANGVPTKLLQFTSNGTAAQNKPSTASQKQPRTAAGSNDRPGSVSPMDVDRPKGQNCDQAQQHKGHDRLQRKQQLQGASKPQDRPPALSPVDKQQQRLSETEQQQQQQLQRLRRRSSVSEQQPHLHHHHQQQHQQQFPAPAAAVESQPWIAQGAVGGSSTEPATPAAAWVTASRAQSNMLPCEPHLAAPAKQRSIAQPEAAVAGEEAVNKGTAEALAPAHANPATAADGTAAAPPAIGAGLLPIDSVAVEVDDTLDFGDDDDEAAALTVGAAPAARDAGAGAVVHADAGAAVTAESAPGKEGNKGTGSDAAAPAAAAQVDSPPVNQQQTEVHQEQPTQQQHQDQDRDQDQQQDLQQQQQQGEDHEEHLLSGITEISAEDDPGHRHEEHITGPLHQATAAAAAAPPPAQPSAAAKASTSLSEGSKPAGSLTSGGSRVQLKRGKVPVPYPPPPTAAAAAAAAPCRSGSRPTSPGSRSRSRGRSRSRAHGTTSRSLSRGRSRRRSGSRSRGRGRRGSSSRARSKSPCNRRRHSSRDHSRSRSRRSSSSRSSSRSRGRSRDRRSRSRGRSRRRSRSGTGSRSPGHDAAAGSRRCWQGSWQRRNSGDHSNYQQQQHHWQKGSSRPGAPVYINHRNRGRGGAINMNTNRSGEWAAGERDNGISIRGGRGGRGGFAPQPNGRGSFQRMGSRQYSGQYAQFGPRDRSELQQHESEDQERPKDSEQQQQQHDSPNEQQHQQQLENGRSPPDEAAADAALHGSDNNSFRAGRGNGRGRGRGRGRGPAAAAGNGAITAAAPFSTPGQDGAVVEGAVAPRILGKDGGKYDWPPKEPKDANGVSLHPATAAAAAAEIPPTTQVNHLVVAAALHPRPHPRPMVRKCYPVPAAAAAAVEGPMSSVCNGTAPQRQSVFQRLGDADLAAAATAAAGGNVHHDLPSSHDRWQPRDDDIGGPAMTSGSDPGRTPNSSALKASSPRAAAAAGRNPGSGHAVAAKRKLGPSITDLSRDSSPGGGSPASFGAKKARGSSPGHSGCSA